MATKATLKRYSGLQFVEFYPKTTHDQIIASGTPSNTTFLRGDGVWATPAVSGTGDVTGPASSVDNRIAVFNGTTGKIIKDSGTLISGLALTSHTHDDRYYTETEIDAKIDFAIRLQVYPNTKNTSGSTIPKGAVVQFAGSQGDFSLIKQAVASEINANPSLLMGIARDAILNDAFGDVVWFGNVLEIATGSLTTGQILWFDTTTGGLTATEPATNKIQLAAVQKASSTSEATNGILLVRIKYVSRNIDEVDGLTDALDGKLNTSGDTMTGPLKGQDLMVISRKFEMLNNQSTQYILLCRNAGNNDINGHIRIDRTSGHYQIASLDVIVTSTTSAIIGGSIFTHQFTESDENYDLVTLTYGGNSWVAIRYTGNTYPYSTSNFTGILRSTDEATSFTTVVPGSVTGVALLSTANTKFKLNNNNIFHDAYHPNADKLTTERNIALAGDVTGSANFDGSGNISITATVQDDSHNHVIGNVDGLQDALNTKLNLTGGTMTGTLTIDTGGTSENALVIRGTAPTISFIDEGSSDDFYLHVNGSNFYILRDTAGADLVGTGYDSPYPLQLEGDTNLGYLFGNRIFTEAYHPNADTLTTARTISLAGDVTGSASFNGGSNISITATVADDSHNHIIGNVDGLQDALNAKLNTSARGAVNGVASLDANSKIPVAQLPDSVFDSLYFNGGGMPGDSEFPLSYLSAYSIRDAKQTNRSPLGYYYVALSGGTFTFTDVWVTFGSPQPQATSFPVFGRVFQQTLTLTQGSAVVPYTSASSSDIGLSVLGTGFPTGTTIVSFTSTTITLSNTATVNGSQSFQFGYYVTISTPSLEEGIEPGSNDPSVTLEPADWFVITKLTGDGTLSDPYEVTWGFVNNTYELATDVVHGITKLSNITSVSSSTTGNEVITQGVLGGLIGTAANTIAAGDDARFTDARTPTAHTHVKADITDFAHTHGNITNAGAIGTAANLVVVTGTSGVLTTASRSGIDSRTAFPTTYANITGTVPTWNQSTTGNAATATTAQSVVLTVTGTTSAELVRGNMADNDQFRILVGGTASNAGFAEIATADDGTEPIHVRQYTGVFTTLVRTATLLDGSGNTSLPGSLTVGGNISLTGASSLSTSTGALTLSTAAGNGNIILSPNGTGVITSTARLGLGTTSPTSVIHVKNATPEIKLEAGSTTDSGTMRYNTTTKSIEFIFV